MVMGIFAAFLQHFSGSSSELSPRVSAQALGTAGCIAMSVVDIDIAHQGTPRTRHAPKTLRPTSTLNHQQHEVKEAMLTRCHSHSITRTRTATTTTPTHAEATTTSTEQIEGGHVGSRSQINTDATHLRRTGTTIHDGDDTLRTRRCEGGFFCSVSQQDVTSSHYEQSQRAKKKIPTTTHDDDNTLPTVQSEGGGRGMYGAVHEDVPADQLCNENTQSNG